MKLNNLKSVVVGITGCDIDSRRRNRKLVEARGIFYKIAREVFNFPLEEIGKSVDRSHGSVIHTLNHFKYWRVGNPQLIAMYKDCLDLVSDFTEKKDQDQSVHAKLISLQKRNEVLEKELASYKSTVHEQSLKLALEWFQTSITNCTTKYLEKTLQQKFWETPHKRFPKTNEGLQKLVRQELEFRHKTFQN